MAKSILDPAETMFVYGMLVAMAGALGYYEIDFASMTPIISSNVLLVLAVVLAGNIRDVTLKRGEPGYRAMIACVHVAIILPLVFSLACAWRLYKAIGVPEKEKLVKFFVFDIVMSILATVNIAIQKPKSEPKLVTSSTSQAKATRGESSSKPSFFADDADTATPMPPSEKSQEEKKTD